MRIHNLPDKDKLQPMPQVQPFIRDSYPYCYSGYLVSCSLHDFTAEASDAAFSLLPFVPCAAAVFLVLLALAVTRFGKKEMR